MSLRLYLFEVITDQKQGALAGALKGVLRVLSAGYALAVRAWRAVYAYQLLPVRGLGKPVISVGNITWGGVGKTPFVEWLIKHFLEIGLRPAILTRGYMPRSEGEVSSAGSDEVLMLREKFPAVPVAPGRDRRSSAQRVLSQHPVDAFILDDGFQQLAIKKDLNIVVIDAANPFGNRFLLPRGPLREPLSSLRRADVFVLTKTDQAAGPLAPLEAQLQSWNRAAVLVETVHRPVSFSVLANRAGGMTLADIQGCPVFLLSGIGDPGSFAKSVAGLGAVIRDREFFADHYCFSSRDVESIARRCREKNIRVIIMTAKDAVKWRADFDRSVSALPVLVLNIEIEVTKGKEALLARIRAVYHR